MPQVAEVTYRYLVNLQKVDGVFAPLLAPFLIMKGGDADNQDAADFVLARSFHHLRLTADALSVTVAGVGMRNGHNTGGSLAQRVTQFR